MGDRSRRLRKQAIREMDLLYRVDQHAHDAVLAVVRVLAALADKTNR